MTQAEKSKKNAAKSEDKSAITAASSEKKKKGNSKKSDGGKVAVAAAIVKTKAKAAEAEDEATPVSSLPFQVNDKHKMALVKLLYCHRDKTAVTYEDLSREIGVGEKTKSWQCGAWRDLKVHEYVVVSSSNNNKAGTCYELSSEGVKLAKTFASDEDLANMKMPETNEELHASIRTRLESQKKTKKYGPLIFDVVLEANDPMSRYEIAAKLNTNADSHGFFYSLQQLKKKMGLVCVAKAKGNGKSRQLLELSEKAFLVSATTSTTTGESTTDRIMKVENKNAAISDDEEIQMKA